MKKKIGFVSWNFCVEHELDVDGDMYDDLFVILDTESNRLLYSKHEEVKINEIRGLRASLPILDDAGLHYLEEDLLITVNSLKSSTDMEVSDFIKASNKYAYKHGLNLDFEQVSLGDVIDRDKLYERVCQQMGIPARILGLDSDD